MQELLSEYILLEDYFMAQNIRKAIQQHQQIDKTISEPPIVQQLASSSITPSASSISLSSAAGSSAGDDGKYMYI